MTHCSLQLCLCLFYNQTRRIIYRSGEALYGECSYIEEEAVYVINIQGKTVQWESQKKSYIIIRGNILNPTQTSKIICASSFAFCAFTLVPGCLPVLARAINKDRKPAPQSRVMSFSMSDLNAKKTKKR